MFKRLRPIDKPVEMRFEDRLISAEEGDTVAAALLAAGVILFRELGQDNIKRGPYCMIGNCFECLVEIDGEENRQACQHHVRDGMQVRIQSGFRNIGNSDES